MIETLPHGEGAICVSKIVSISENACVCLCKPTEGMRLQGDKFSPWSALEFFAQTAAVGSSHKFSGQKFKGKVVRIRNFKSNCEMLEFNNFYLAKTNLPIAITGSLQIHGELIYEGETLVTGTMLVTNE